MGWLCHPDVIFLYYFAKNEMKWQISLCWFCCEMNPIDHNDNLILVVIKAQRKNNIKEKEQFWTFSQILFQIYISITHIEWQSKFSANTRDKQLCWFGSWSTEMKIPCGIFSVLRDRPQVLYIRYKIIKISLIRNVQVLIMIIISTRTFLISPN